MRHVPSRRHSPLILVACSLLLAAIACNLSSESRPPTIIPRASPTPPPTIGYATIEPEELPQEATISAPDLDEVVLLNLFNQVQPDRLYMYVSALQNMGTRMVTSAKDSASFGVGGAEQYILNQFNAIRDQSQGRFITAAPQPFTVEWAGIQTIGTNIVGVLSGREAGAGVIVLGAHYDSISVDREDALAAAPGANDNATGVAALIEIARIMSQRQPRATVLFVAFGAEEIGRVGSKAFVEQYILPSGIQVDAMINLDIIGSSTSPNGAIVDDRIRLFSAEPNNSPSRNLARMVNLIASRHVPMMSIEVEATVDREGRFSDHISFSDAGFAAVRFIEFLEDPNRNHTDRDTIDAVRPSYLLRSTQAVLGVATALAEGPRPPRSIVLRENGDATRTLVWETREDATSYVVALRQPGSLVYNYYFDVTSNSVTWDGFRADRWEAIAIASRDRDGLMGPLSQEYIITS
jgi:hypothetical protein